MPVRQPRKRKDTASTMASASRNERSNSQTDSATTRGWSAYCWICTPAGSSCRTCASRSSSARPKSSTLPLALHRHADGQHRHAVVADGQARRVLVAGAHGRDVGQPQQLAAHLQRHVGDVARRCAARRPHAPARGRGWHRPSRRGHQVLARQRFEHRRRGDAQRGQPLRRQLHIHALGLLAQHVDLGAPSTLWMRRFTSSVTSAARPSTGRARSRRRARCSGRCTRR